MEQDEGAFVPGHRGTGLAGPPFGDFFAMVKHQQARAQALGLVHEVGGEQDALALLQQGLQPLPHQVAGLGVQPGGGLVEQQQLGVVDQGPGQREPALHAAREFAGARIGLVREGGEIEQGGNAWAQRLGVQAEVAPVDQQVLRTGEVGVQGVHLADHPQLLLDPQRVARHLVSEGLDGPGVGCRESEAHADGGGFARAIGADHAQAFARGDRKREVVDHGLITVALDQIPAFKKGSLHGWALCPPGGRHGVCRGPRLQ